MLAFELYCTIPKGKDTVNNPLIKELANFIGRTPDSVKMRLQNFKSYDPSYTNDGRTGLSNGGRLAKEIYEEFSRNWDNLIFRTKEIKSELGISDSCDISEHIAGMFIG